MSQSSTLSAEHRWFLQEWGSALAIAVESMGSDRPQVGEGRLAAEFPQDTEACSLTYQLNIVDGPALGIGAPELTWKEVGTRVLTGVGMEAPAQQLCLETYQEVVGQAVSHLAQSLSSRLEREVVFAVAQQAPWPLDSALVAVVEVQFGSQTPVALYAQVSTGLLKAISAPGAAATHDAIVPSGRPAVEELGTLEDLEMGVTVSLGTARLSLAEALTLGPGSIVQLSSLVDDLVVVKVDGKIVARGEVVVVDNSYAIRITHLADRDQRFSSSPHVRGKVAGAGE
jgi:flagellar motor switch protein FliN